MYGVITTVAAPIEMYDGLHNELADGSAQPSTAYWSMSDAGPAPASRSWKSGSPRNTCDRANAQIVYPLMRELAGDQAAAISQQTDTFDIRGLVIPSGTIYI